MLTFLLNCFTIPWPSAEQTISSNDFIKIFFVQDVVRSPYQKLIVMGYKLNSRQFVGAADKNIMTLKCSDRESTTRQRLDKAHDGTTTDLNRFSDESGS